MEQSEIFKWGKRRFQGTYFIQIDKRKESKQKLQFFSTTTNKI